MGGGSGSSTSTYSPPPEVAAAYKDLLAKAGPLVNQQQVRYTPDEAAYYAGLVPATLAPLTPYQVEGGQNIANLAGFTTPYVQSATDLYTNAANPLNRQQFSGSAVDQYMSPYMQNVMQGAVQNINETNAQQDQQILGNAIAKGAFGGDRAGIVRGQLARQQDLANNATLANLLNQGYTQALGEFNQQQGVDLATQMQNRTLQQQAGTNLLNAAGSGQTMALQQALAEMGVGQQQQQQRQQELSTAYQNFMNEQGYPYQQLGFQGSLTSGVATGMGGTTTSNPAQPSGLSQIIGGLGALGSVGSMFGSSGILSGLGAALGLSDERAKDNIQPVGKTFDGQNIYKFNYKGDPRTQIGLMAQEVEHKHPSAVHEVNGLKMVNYEDATREAAHKKHFYNGGRAHYDDGGATPMSKVQPMQFFGGVQMKGASPHVPQAPAPQKQDDLSSAIKNATPGLKALDKMFTPDKSKLDGTPAPDAPTPPPRPPEFSDTSAFSGDASDRAYGGRARYASGGDAVPSSLANLSSATSHLPGGLPQASSGTGGLGGLSATPQVDQNAVTTENIYRTLLHRSAEPAAIAGRSAELASGASTPQSIMDQTKASPEYKALMNDPTASNLLPPPPQAPAAYQNYQNLVNSGHASLADLQKGYNNYLSSAQTPIMPFQALPTIASAKAASDAAAAASDPTSKLTADQIATLQQMADKQANQSDHNAKGGRIRYANGGSTDISLQYGAPSLADLQNLAEMQAGSGVSGISPNAEALALKDMGLAFGGRAHFGKGGSPSSSDASDNSVPADSDTSPAPQIEPAMDAYKRAISGIETPNLKNPYDAVGPINPRNGDRPFGKFQVMGNNVPSWTEAALGKRMTPSEFLNNPDAQEKTFEHRFGTLLKQYGNPQDAASAWHSGVSLDEAQKQGRHDVNMTTTNYVNKFNNLLNSTAGGQDLLNQINQGAVRSGQDDRQKTIPLDPNTRLPINQPSTKEGLWGALGVSTTPSERLALFNAFATLAGTPGKFGVGLAAAGRTYADTLMKSQEQYQKGVGYQSEAEQRYAQAEKEKREANIVQGRQGFGQIVRNEKGEPIGVQTLPEIKQNAPAPTAQQPLQQAQQSPFQQQPSAQTTGAPIAPTAPVGPSEAKVAPKIDMSSYNYGPVDTRSDADPNSPVNNKEAYMRQQAVNFGSDFGTGAADNYKVYQDAIKEYSEDNRAAARNAQNLAEATRDLAKIPDTGAVSPGAFAKIRYAAVDTLNMGARVFGIKDDNGQIMQLDPAAISAGEQLNKLAAISTQLQKHGNEAMGWSNIQRLANPNVDLNKETSADILANMWTTNAMLRDNFTTASKYGEMTNYQGANVKDVVSKVNDPNLYQREQKIIADLLKLKNPKDPNDKSNPIVRLLDGADKNKFNKWLAESEYGVPNLSRVFVPR